MSGILSSNAHNQNIYAPQYSHNSNNLYITHSFLMRFFNEILPILLGNRWKICLFSGWRVSGIESAETYTRFIEII